MRTIPLVEPAILPNTPTWSTSQVSSSPHSPTTPMVGTRLSKRTTRTPVSNTSSSRVCQE
ncbi:hypothetical protein TorRG33x02_306970 [Trema orientale]|uniref:Uncharacterized protein n=1 Tax=Trema orientale TaxID=63057 RepID=A0A2P5BVP8_TREOI|nr:hypothetical protein TorRG33x02_306970 [Trema orientale]